MLGDVLGVCRSIRGRVYLLYALSGFLSLGYQVAWFRIWIDRFGSTNLAFALVVCNFIGGLGAGALLSNRVCAVFVKAAPRFHDQLRLYGALELLVSLSVCLTFLVGLVPADLWGSFPYHLDDGTGVWQPNLSYGLSQAALAVVCAFVPCFFMGVTFPLLCEAYGDDDRFPAALYAWNTLGACIGVLACLFLFLPLIGHAAMLWGLVAVNLGLGAFFVTTGGASAAADRRTPEPGDTTGSRHGEIRFLLACAALSGLLAGALEGDMYKRLDFLASGDGAIMALISFWAILAIFLASWAIRARSTWRLSGIKLAWVAGLAAYAAAWRWEREIFVALRNAGGTPLDLQGEYLHGFGRSLLFVGIFVFPAFFCVSLLLPFVCNRAQARRRHLGLAYGLNTLAFCAGMVAFTQLAPRVSVFYSMKLMIVLFAIAAGLLLVISESRRLAAWKPAAAVLLAAVACVLVPRGFDRGHLIPGGMAATFPVRSLKSNGAHTTYVVGAPWGDYLFFERHPMSGTYLRESSYMRLMAHFPLLAHPDPRRALLICYGVGHTASAIATHDTIEAIDVVELNEKVVETAPEFAGATNAVHRDPRLRFIIDDGRRFLRLTDRTYDLITSEPPPPMQAGVYRLYAREYYQQALSRLSPGGMMTQWIPTVRMPAEAVELAIATFIDVFPHALIFTGGGREFVLVGGREPIDLARLERRFDDQPAAAADLRRMGINRPVSLLARIVHGDGSLRRRFGAGRVISDARNDLEFVFHERARQEVLAYAPAETLDDLDLSRLACAQELRAVMTHLGRLVYRVPDYPVTWLLRPGSPEQGTVPLADLDWSKRSQYLDGCTRLRAAGRHEDVREVLELALELNPQQPDVLLRLASIQIALGRPGDALATLAAFAEIEPDEEAGHRVFGVALWTLERREEAVAALRRAVAADPRSPDAHHALGGALLVTGSTEEGHRHLHRALELDPGRQDTRRLLSAAAGSP